MSEGMKRAFDGVSLEEQQKIIGQWKQELKQSGAIHQLEAESHVDEVKALFKECKLLQPQPVGQQKSDRTKTRVLANQRSRRAAQKVHWNQRPLIRFHRLHHLARLPRLRPLPCQGAPQAHLCRVQSYTRFSQLSLLSRSERASRGARKKVNSTGDMLYMD